MLPPGVSVLHSFPDARYPVVVKPAATAGSYCVTCAHNRAQLVEAVNQFRARLPAYLARMGHGAASECSTSGMIVEELLAGSEVDVDCIVQDGQLLFACVSDNHTSGGEAFVKTGGRCPSTRTPPAQELWWACLTAVRIHTILFLLDHTIQNIQLRSTIQRTFSNNAGQRSLSQRDAR
ncbi:ATP-grasp domain-containing protein [Haematococcus lacustris]|uniref:ATP-grasp domain-containing protein n=1 Tax=Haematococcus lacustris TaxID=44745 RepID=A0A699Y883_HAELA|nr:ATP-grasp domain-containing protein [Haematococcus lacustris]